jgi:hypothetical protein
MRARTGLPLLTVGLLGTLLPGVSSAQIRRPVQVVPGQITITIVDTTGTPYSIPFPRALVYRALLDVFADLKVPGVSRDSAAGRVEAPTFYRQGDFAGSQISAWLGCGDSMTGPNADNYRVYMYLASTVTADGENASSIRSVLLGGAMNVSEGSRQAMPCESTGRLEVRIYKMVLKKAAGI